VECEGKSEIGINRGDWNHFNSLRQYLSNILGEHEIKVK
jgi:hypothetical protein